MQLEILTEKPDQQTHQTPILFLHGMWHGAWCWAETFLPYFADAGFTAHALSLRGHGKSEGKGKIRWTRVSDYVDDLTQAVNSLNEKPILVGHSMGGFVVQKYLEDHQVPAAVLLASVPPKGMLSATVRTARRHFGPFMQANLTLSMYPVIGTVKRYQEVFFSDQIEPDLLQEYYGQTQDEAYMAYMDMLMLNLPKVEKINTPLLVLGSDGDQAITASEVKATAERYQAPFKIFPQIGHAMMLDVGWRKVAAFILDWLKQQNL